MAGRNHRGAGTPSISIRKWGWGGARDVRPITRGARIEALLTPLELIEIRQTLISARLLRRSLARLALLFPRLAARAETLPELPVVIDTIARAINDRAEVADGASDELSRIRNDLNTTRSRLLDKLQRFLSSPGNAKNHPGADHHPARRAVRDSDPAPRSKGRLAGIVHDTSASGATIFVEPLSVVEMGNRLRELEREEAREVERILRELTALVAAHADAIDGAVETLAEIDLAFAKAKFSAEMRGVAPAGCRGDRPRAARSRTVAGFAPGAPSLAGSAARRSDFRDPWGASSPF